MILNLYAVHDRQADTYYSVQFIAGATGEAIRAFADQINKPDAQNPLYNHPDDFDLFYFGTFNTQTGLFSTGVPESVAIGKNLKVNGS